MIISVNWLKEYTKIDMPIDELATLIGARLVEIEEVIDVSEKYRDVVLARVVECKKLEASDHLNVTKLDDGGKAAGVERDENGLVQVVCGAPNVRENMLVAWLPPQSIVPETHGTADPFVLGARKLRGVMSNGMIASARELDLFDDHTGILEIAADAKPGTSFSQLFALDDTLLDIENKSLTHRPDVFGIIGFAREIAGIQGKIFTTPKWLATIQPSYGEKAVMDTILPKVMIDDAELSARYQGVVVSHVDGSVKTPLPLQTYLARVGMRPINAIVDITNYLMLVTGQPLHAFDYDKLAAVNNGNIDIHVRAGRDDETLELLDGRTITLSTEDIIIANGDVPVALAGAMGGAATEVDENTETIFLESATFNLYNLRATQMRHGIFSEAITRFTKGQPAELTAPVLAKAVELLREFMGAMRASDVVEDYPRKREHHTVDLSVADVNETLGTDLTAETMAATLEAVEFKVEHTNDALRVTAPYWRHDIAIPEDIIEEIGRLNGYDSITPILPRRDFVAVTPSGFDELRGQVRDILARGGANEALTYSFVHGKVLEKAHQKPEDSYRITNSISPDLQYYRQTLTPSLLQHIHSNVKQGFDTFALYELNKTHLKSDGLTEAGVPVETDMLALTITSKKAAASAAYYNAKRMLDYMATSLGLEFSYAAIESELNLPIAAPFEYRRAALVTEVTSNILLGIVGEYKKSVTKNFKLPEATAGFEIRTQELWQAVQKRTSSYCPLSRYPGTERDICFQVSSDTPYGRIEEQLKYVLDNEPLEAS
ncbi:MAG TPA: phenylalanine--tRNA ligase subunit beta, partial [Candidatus Saccharimonadales bacterium]|nr:phenylalanine--tRNA ligase subunit beta [Candidatus Saccharimonadales bacterium]